MATTVVRPDAARLWPVGFVLALPLLGLAVPVAKPELDMAWEHHPSHFWIVLVAAAVNVVLAYVTNIAAGRYRDARLTLISFTRDVAGAHPGWPIFRIGINTGPAVVGVIGTAARRSFAAIGDPVNTGARLQTAAEPGQAVIGRTTWEALGDPTAGQPLGAIRVKGKRDPVEAWRLRLPA